MQEFDITMLGVRRIGKTSLLTAMYDNLKIIIDKTNLKLKPEPKSKALLDDRKEELKTLLDSFECGLGTEPTKPGVPRSFIFDIAKRDSKPSLRIMFKDPAGIYFDPNARKEERALAETLLENCVAVIIPIDAPALMETKKGTVNPNEIGYWHEAVNKPWYITKMFREVYKDINSPRLVILTPVKCEKYMRNQQDAENLLAHVKMGYAQLIEFFKSSDALRTNVAVVVTPVQTVGNVVFSHIEEVGSEVKFNFHKTSFHAEYDPRDGDQPLRYLLRFLLNLHIQEKRNNFWPFNYVYDLFALDKQFKNAVEELAKDCKDNNGFAILQGFNLLKK